MKKIKTFKKNRIVCGVMEELRNNFEVDPTIVRVLFLIFSFSGFPIILISYLLSLFQKGALGISRAIDAEILTITLLEYSSP